MESTWVRESQAKKAKMKRWANKEKLRRQRAGERRDQGDLKGVIIEEN